MLHNYTTKEPTLTVTTSEEFVEEILSSEPSAKAESCPKICVNRNDGTTVDDVEEYWNSSAFKSEIFLLYIQRSKIHALCTYFLTDPSTQLQSQ